MNGFKSQNLFAKLDGAIVGKAISDLMSVDERICFPSARYFFLDGKGVDDGDHGTFTALCERNGLGPDRAAKAVWKQLTPVQQEHVLGLLKKAGY